jgi:hypothetical protein
MRPDETNDIGVERVLGEEVLNGDRQQCDLRVKERRVESGDAVPVACGPPAPKPVPQRQPSQRLERSRTHVDAGQFDGLRLVG